MTQIKMINDFQISGKTRSDVTDLLDLCFPDTFKGRTYFKQLPHLRLFAHDESELVAQLGLDFRVINVGGTVLKIVGLIDLCVHPDHRNMGLGTGMLNEVEVIARGVDFAILMADNPVLYQRVGFEKLAAAPTKWLAIEDRESVLLIERDLSYCFMVRQLGAIPWPGGQIDMLGYLF